MAGEVAKAVQQEQPAAPAPMGAPAGLNQDVEMTDAMAATKTQEQVQPITAENPPKPTESAVPESTSASNLVKASKDAAIEPDPAPEAPKTDVQEPTVPKPTEAAAPHTEATPGEHRDVVAETADHTAEAAPEKLADGPTQPPEAPVNQPVEDSVKKAEAAEDAAVKMLASNLDAPVSGKSDSIADSQQPTTQTESHTESGIGSQIEKSPVAGQKRKAEDDTGANGDPASKKANVEATPATATNGSPSPRKAGRPKKEKKPPAPIGKTARRTRSQGAADI